MQQFNKLKFSIANDNFDVGYLHKLFNYVISVNENLMKFIASYPVGSWFIPVSRAAYNL